MQRVVEKHKGYFRCPKCGNMDFHIDAESMANGERPTVIECSACGWTGFA